MTFARWFKPNSNKQQFSTLYRWNIGLAALHAIQGIVILALSGSRTLPVTTNYLVADPMQSKAAEPVLVAASSHWFEVNLAYLIAGFFFMSAIAHVLVATRYRRTYEADLKKGINKARWIEYAVSASTMMVAIGLLVGVYDAMSLLMLFALTAVMNLLGLAMEVYNQGKSKPNWLAYVIGCIAGVVPWLVIAGYLLAGAVYGSQAPAFVYWIFVSIFVLFSCFAINMFLQYRRQGRWADYLYGERIYMTLSLVAKTALAWQVFAGTLRP